MFTYGNGASSTVDPDLARPCKFTEMYDIIFGVAFLNNVSVSSSISAVVARSGYGVELGLGPLTGGVNGIAGKFTGAGPFEDPGRGHALFGVGSTGETFAGIMGSDPDRRGGPSAGKSSRTGV